MSLDKVQKKLSKSCPPRGMLAPPCPGVNLTSTDKKRIITKFKGMGVPVDKIRSALDYAVSNHQEAARRADWVMASIKDEEFTGARGRRRKTKRRRQKGGLPGWIEDKICTLLIMLTIGGGFWYTYPIVEGFLITYGILPALCSAGTGAAVAAEHVGVYFGNQLTHGAVLTCLERDNQYRAVLASITVFLSGSGYVTRETVSNSYNETHAWVKAQLFGRGGIFGEPVSPEMHTPPSPPPSASPTPPLPLGAPPAAPVAHLNPLVAPPGSSSSSSSNSAASAHSAASQGSQPGMGKKRRTRRKRGRRKSKRGGRKSKRRTARRRRTRRC